MVKYLNPLVLMHHPITIHRQLNSRISGPKNENQTGEIFEL